MKWVYLSPHYDDAVLSCGGLIWNQTNQGDEVEVWTIFGGDPPSGELSMFAQILHYRWGIPVNSVEIRREEDRVALELLGAKPRHFNFMDCIYRKSSISGEFLYEDMEMITGEVREKETKVRKGIKMALEEFENLNASIIAPLGIGNHIDHRIIHEISSQLRIDIMYYLDFPYVFRGNELDIQKLSKDLNQKTYSLDSDILEVWMEAIAIYRSQISSFWDDEDAMREEIMDFSKKMGGVKLFYRDS